MPFQAFIVNAPKFNSTSNKQKISRVSSIRLRRSPYPVLRLKIIHVNAPKFSASAFPNS